MIICGSCNNHPPVIKKPGALPLASRRWATYCLRATVLALLSFTSFNVSAQQTTVPRITGISHVGYFVSDLSKALTFWVDFLGFQNSYDLKTPKTSEVQIAFIKINDHQHIELFTETPTIPHNFMSHLCFTVDDVEQMRSYLRSKGFEIRPNPNKTRAGDYAFEIKDPDGTLIEFVQTLPGGLETKAAGKYQPSTRISDSVYHVGFLVGNSQKSLEFYGNILGFKETWRGGADPKKLSWINMRVPDGTDYIEFMLHSKLPDPSTWGGSNHISLLVPDIAKAVATLESRPAYKTYGKPLTIRTGINQKHQVNLFDPDGTRVELMEARTITGLPTPPSTAPPPTPEP